jgi:hypothetical protein
MREFFVWLCSLFAPKPVPAPAPVAPAPVKSVSKQDEELAQKSLAFAMKYLGQKEATGNNDGQFVNMIQEWVGGSDEHGAPWCACFASWCIYMTAADLSIKPKIIKTDSSTDFYAWGKKNNMLLSQPIPGCLGLIKGNGGNPDKTHHHTFRVISVDLSVGTVVSIDGNWGNAVAKTDHRIQDCDFVAIA